MKRLFRRLSSNVEPLLVAIILGIMIGVAITRYATAHTTRHVQIKHKARPYKYAVIYSYGPSNSAIVFCNRIAPNPCGLTLNDTNDGMTHQCVQNAKIEILR